MYFSNKLANFCFYYATIILYVLSTLVCSKLYLVGEKLANYELFDSPKFFSPIFTDTPKMYMAYALTVAYSPNFSSPIAFTCMVHQNFPPSNISRVLYNSFMPIQCMERISHEIKQACNIM